MSRSSEPVKDFATPKGHKFLIYSGTKRTPAAIVQFKQDGDVVDITSWGTMYAIIKRGGKDDDNAVCAAFECDVNDATNGKINVPFDEQTISGTGEDLRLIVYEVHDTDKEKIRAKFKVDIYDSELDA